MASLNHELVREMIRTGTPDRVLRLIGKSHPADVAPLFKGLEPSEARLLFDVLFSTRKAAKTLKELSPDLLTEVLGLIDDEKLGRVISRADPDDAVTFIASLPEERRERVLTHVDPERRAGFNKMISYPEGTVGRIMTTDLLSLSPDITAQGAIDKIRERGELETFFYLYVVDEAGKLIGVVPIRNLVVAPPGRPLRDMMIADPIRAEVSVDQEEAARIVSKYDLLALPIVDRDGRLLGLITVDDVIDVIADETTEDMYKMAGVGIKERAFSPLRESAARRVPWLGFNMVWAFAAASVISFFEKTIGQVPSLAIFMPIIAGQAGSAGIQTATVVVRSMALGEIESTNLSQLLRKEWGLGLIKGTLFGGVLGVVAWLWKGNATLGLIAGVAMFLNMLVAATAGVLVPTALRKLGFDPATVAGVFDTMLTDFMGFLIFLGLATLLIHFLT
ncbi:MAG TPA: magnesium transporter [Candidatus Binatia bacterium]|jgi:magnesium transporter